MVWVLLRAWTSAAPSCDPQCWKTAVFPQEAELSPHDAGGPRAISGGHESPWEDTPFLLELLVSTTAQNKKPFLLCPEKSGLPQKAFWVSVKAVTSCVQTCQDAYIPITLFCSIPIILIKSFSEVAPLPSWPGSFFTVGADLCTREC